MSRPACGWALAGARRRPGRAAEPHLPSLPCSHVACCVRLIFLFTCNVGLMLLSWYFPRCFGKSNGRLEAKGRQLERAGRGALCVAERGTPKGLRRWDEAKGLEMGR